MIRQKRSTSHVDAKQSFGEKLAFGSRVIGPKAR